jgi:hypothetical protein
MGRRHLRVAIPAALLVCAGSVVTLPADPGAGLGGWVVPWDFDAGMESLARSHGLIDEVFLFAARFDTAGQIVLDVRKARWPEGVRDAHAAGPAFG